MPTFNVRLSDVVRDEAQVKPVTPAAGLAMEIFCRRNERYLRYIFIYRENIRHVDASGSLLIRVLRKTCSPG